MTTDELIMEFVKALQDETVGWDEGVKAFDRFHPRVVHSTEDVMVWSIALNDDTRDVRYVMADAGSGFVGEVAPQRTVAIEYVAV